MSVVLRRKVCYNRSIMTCKANNSYSFNVQNVSLDTVHILKTGLQLNVILPTDLQALKPRHLYQCLITMLHISSFFNKPGEFKWNWFSYSFITFNNKSVSVLSLLLQKIKPESVPGFRFRLETNCHLYYQIYQLAGY